MSPSPLQYVTLDPRALGAALDAWAVAEPGFRVFALLPEAEVHGLPVLRAACADRGVPLVGAVFPALLVDGRFVTAGVWLCRAPGDSPALLVPLPPGEAGAPAIAGAVLAALPICGPEPVLHLVFDTFVPDIASIVEALYLELADRVRYGGAAAGSETFAPMPCLFDERQFVDRAVLVQLLPGSPPLLEHGYPAPEHGRIATSTQGNRIRTIDWRPALEVYRELVEEETGLQLDPDAFYAGAIHFPLGIVRANRDVVVRIPVATEADGSVFCVGEVPENTVLVLLRAPLEPIGCVEALGARLDAPKDHPLLTFYCAGRRGHLGDTAERELTRLGALTSAGVGGALSLGEVGSTLPFGYPLLHNAAIACMSWSG